MDDKTLIQTHTLTVEEGSKQPNFFLLPKPRQGYYLIDCMRKYAHFVVLSQPLTHAQ